MFIAGCGCLCFCFLLSARMGIRVISISKVNCRCMSQREREAGHVSNITELNVNSQQPKLCCNYSKDGWNSCSAPLRCKKLKTLCHVANIDSKQKSTSSHFTLRMLLNMESSESLLNSLSVFAMLNYISLSILFICSGRITGIFGKTDILKIG